jgi:hypothetical protein
METISLIKWVYALVFLAAGLFLAGAVKRVFWRQEATLWWRGAMGVLAFAVTLLLLEIYYVLLER